MSGMKEQERHPLRSIVRLTLMAALVASASCKRGDANAEPAGNDSVVIGPENIVVVVDQEIRTGPALSGTLAPEREATIRAEVQAPVVETLVEQGQRVAAGQLLLRLDDTAIRDQLLSAKSTVTTAQANLTVAQHEQERNETLLNAGAIAERAVEQSRAQVTAARAQLATAQAQLASAEKQSSNTRITAPFAGIVSARAVNAGDVVSMGGALITVVDPSTMRLEASVPAEALGAVRLGAPVDFSVTGYPNRHFTGRVTRINPIADPATRQVRIIASLPNSGGTLVGGLFAEGRVSSESHRAPVVAQSAVDERGLRPSVVRLKSGRAEKTEVTLGLRDAATETVEVTQGLTPGDTVLLGAARGISPGTPVRVSAPNDAKK
ncbi:MAG: efflux RND transporter periplasmic adaptor subunit [Gemmatimonadaceae bacterium]